MSEDTTEKTTEYSSNPMFRAVQMAGKVIENLNSNPEIVNHIGEQAGQQVEKITTAVNTNGDTVIDKAEMDALLQNPDKMEALMQALPESARANVAEKLTMLAEAEAGLTDEQRAQIPQKRAELNETLNANLDNLKQNGISVEQQVDAFAERANPLVKFMADKISPEVIQNAQTQVDGIVAKLPDDVELPENITISDEVKATLQKYASKSTGQPFDDLLPPSTPKFDNPNKEPALSI
jgi:hypothetical protein